MGYAMLRNLLNRLKTGQGLPPWMRDGASRPPRSQRWEVVPERTLFPRIIWRWGEPELLVFLLAADGLCICLSVLKAV